MTILSCINIILNIDIVSYMYNIFQIPEIIPKKCERVRCDIAIKRKCPVDSTLVQIESKDSCCKVSYQCVCNKNSCKKTVCAPGYESVLHQPAEGHPGSCCDQYVCELSGQ